MSQVGTAWCWPPDDRVCPLRPGWLMAFLSLRRVLCGLLEQEGLGYCAELPQGTTCLPPYFPGLINCETPFSVRCGCRLWNGFAAPWSWLLGNRVPPPYAVLLHHVPFFFLCLPFGARLPRSWYFCSSFLGYLCKGWTVLNSSTDLFPPWLDLAAVSCSGLCFLPCHFPGLRSLPHPCCPWYLCHSSRFRSLAKHTVTMIYDLGLFVVIWEAEKTNAHVQFGQKNERIQLDPEFRLKSWSFRGDVFFTDH